MKHVILMAALALAACSTKPYSAEDYFHFLQSKNLQVTFSETDSNTFQAQTNGVSFRVIKEANGADAVATATRINVPSGPGGKGVDGALEVANSGQEAPREKAHIKANLVLVLSEADSRSPDGQTLVNHFQKF